MKMWSPLAFDLCQSDVVALVFNYDMFRSGVGIVSHRCIIIRGRHGFSRGQDFACEVGRGLFRLGVAHRGKREYSLRAKASPCQIFCSEGEE